MEEDFQKAIEICTKVLSGAMLPDEFRQAWPKPDRADDWFDLWADIEFATEHMPGKRRGFFTGKFELDPNAWAESPEYAMIESYLEQLSRGAMPESEWPSEK